MHNAWIRRFLSVSVLFVIVLGLVACGGVSDTTIPTPSGTTEIKKGDDPITDAFIDGFAPALDQTAQQQNGKVDKTAYYNTTMSVADTKSFYETEMPKKGWKKVELSGASQAGVEVLGYESGNNGAIVLMLDNAQLGGTGTFLITVNISK